MSNMERSLEKQTLWSTGLFSHHNSFSLQLVSFRYGNGDFTRVAMDNSTRYNGLSWIKPGAQIGGSCIDQCRLNLLNLNSEFRDSRAFVTTTYGFLPHFYSLDARWKFKGRQELGLGLERQMQALKPTGDPSWLEQADVTSRFRARGTLHLEYINDAWSLSADHDVPIVDKRKESPVYGQLGAQYDSTKIHSGLFFAAPYQSPLRQWNLIFEIRYFFVPNIRTASLQLPMHSIRGRLRSNFAEQPIGGARIQLLSDKNELMNAATDADGSFVFHDVPTSGPLRIRAEKTGVESSLDIEKKLEDREMEVSLTLEDRIPLHIRFVDDAEGKPVALTNFVKELGEGIVHAADAGYDGNTLWLRKGNPAKMETSPELLPFDYTFEKLEELRDKREVIVHLKRRP